MVTQSGVFDKLLDQIASMNTAEESNAVRQEMQKVRTDAHPDEYEQVRLALSKRLNEIAEQGEEEIASTYLLMKK